MEDYLRHTEVIDWNDPSVAARASSLSRPGDIVATARACFEFVRDEIRHSRDYELDPATWRASDVLRYGTGYCYSKSHLLAALLRANGLPTGFCYQRLSVNNEGPPYSLHGFNAIFLPESGWFRVDPRGNKPGVAADFAPPLERLAFLLQAPEEFEFANVFADPLPVVITALRKSRGWKDALAQLPDVSPELFPDFGLIVRRSGNGAGGPADG